MSWFINSDFAAARQPQMGEHAPTLILDFIARNVVFLHADDELFDIITNEIEFVDIVFVRGMNSDFSGRQTEDEPAVADIDVRKLKYIAQKCAISFGICAVDNGMCAGDHNLWLCAEFIEHFGVGLHQSNQVFRIKNAKGPFVCLGFGEALQFVRARNSRMKQDGLRMP